MNEEVTAYIDAIGPEWQTEVCNRLRRLVRESVPEAEELNPYHKPHYRKNGKFVCTYSANKTTVAFTIFNGTAIDDPSQLNRLVADSKIGSTATLKVLRGGRSVEFKLVIVSSASSRRR